ncbi:23S rRNA (adenine(2030)-N(6))-methyltransferase RlmJ [Brackiella oedipodis]|uniref:23S rRNA (adenine(2030)-N(6))-methyltransferase RlmJ n=1 Tax=Brackiella oedipodis TaxID=124225 RepID=UPI00048C439F|nr:23S rRNA (adenine(2030)-N(6))-methyltransferase RlmJ [Brackiella oedipodis]
MFSYRHAFHAGNHADVLKHSVLIHILQHLNKKDKAYSVIDCHAGAGVYDLDSEWAATNQEFATGVSALIEQAQVIESSSLLHAYIHTIGALNSEPNGALTVYPGSPWLCLEYMRDHDRLHLFEWHATEFANLQANIAYQDSDIQKQVKLYHDNGFTALKALLPPPSRRGLILIDPSYEDKNDYVAVLKACQEGFKRFATGTYMIWYPLVHRPQVASLLEGLKNLCGQSLGYVHAALQISAIPKGGHGLYGSGVFVINPPYTLGPALAQALPILQQCLTQDQAAQFTLEQQDK